MLLNHYSQRITGLFVVTLLGGCLSKEVPELPPPPPELQIQEQAIQAEFITPGTETHRLVLINTGTVDTDYKVDTKASGWLSSSPATGSLLVGAQTPLDFTLTCNGLGTLTETIEIQDASGKVLDSVDIELTCVAQPLAEISEINPSTLQLSAFVNQTAVTDISFTNSGGADLTYSVESQSNWITLDPLQGTLTPSSTANIGVSAQCAGNPTQEMGTIVVRSNDLDEDTKSVNVVLNCEATPTATLTGPSPQQLTTDLQVSASADATFVIGNAGLAALTYELRSDESWINIASTPVGGIDPGNSETIAFSVACGASETTRDGSIDITSNDPARTQAVFPIELQCTLPNTPEISELDPTSLDLSAPLNNVANGDFQFSNLGRADLTFTLSASDAWITLTSATSGTLSRNQNATVSLTASCEDRIETRNGSVNIASNDADEPNKVLSVALSCGGLANLSLDRVYFTQTVPAADSDVSEARRIPIVADRPAFVRAFVTGTDSSLTPAVSLILRSNAGVESTIPLSGPDAVPSNPDEGNISDTFNTLLAAGELVPGMDFYVVVDPDNQINESNESDNRYPESGFENLNVEQLATLKVHFVPIDTNGQAPDPIDADAYLKDTLELLPVGNIDADVRSTPLVITEDVSNPCDVLDEVAILREADGANGSGIFYFAIIQRGPGGGIVGCAYTPGYVGAGLSASDRGLRDAQETIAHEFGHNFSLPHAPCGGPNRPDPNFPYSDGSIGVWGYNVFTGDVHSPSGRVKDLMTYCGPVWVSDYNFEKILDYRISRDARIQRASSATRSLLVGGSIDNGQVTVNTVIEVDQPPHVPQPGEYDLVIYDQAGGDPMRISFDAKQVDHQSTQHFLMRVPLPDDPLTLLQVEQQGQLRAEVRAMSPVAARRSAAPLATAREANGRVRVGWDNNVYNIAIVRDEVTGDIVAIDRTGEFVFQSESNSMDVTLSDGLNSHKVTMQIAEQ